MFCRSLSGSQLFAKIISIQKKLPLVRKELRTNKSLFANATSSCVINENIVDIFKELKENCLKGLFICFTNSLNYYFDTGL